MSDANAIAASRRERSTEEISAALRAEWRMISAVSLRPNEEGPGLEAELRLDPIVIEGALEQQGHPRTPAALAKLEERRSTALEDCVRRVNEGLPDDERIQAFSVVGWTNHA